MGYVAATAGLFALGAYLGRDLPYGFSLAGYIAALACLFGMNFTRRSGGASAGLLFAVGLLMAASIFLDALNVFNFFLRLFSGNRE